MFSSLPSWKRNVSMAAWGCLVIQYSKHLFGACSPQIRATVFSEFICCHLESAWTRGTLFLSWPLTKDCGIPWPAVFVVLSKGSDSPPSYYMFFACCQYKVAKGKCFTSLEDVYPMHLPQGCNELIECTETKS